jgi:hypothetical protein
MVARVGEEVSVDPERRTGHPEHQNQYHGRFHQEHRGPTHPHDLGDYTPYDLSTPCLAGGAQSRRPNPITLHKQRSTVAGKGHPPYGVFCTLGGVSCANFGEHPFPRRRVNKALLVWLLALLSWLGAQPQGDVSRLHRLPYHAHKVVTHGIEVCFPATASVVIAGT